MAQLELNWKATLAFDLRLYYKKVDVPIERTITKILTENIQVVFTDYRNQLIFNDLFRFHIIFLVYGFRTVRLK